MKSGNTVIQALPFPHYNVHSNAFISGINWGMIRPCPIVLPSTSCEDLAKIIIWIGTAHRLTDLEADRWPETGGLVGGLRCVHWSEGIRDNTSILLVMKTAGLWRFKELFKISFILCPCFPLLYQQCSVSLKYILLEESKTQSALKWYICRNNLEKHGFTVNMS